mgnify:CR=1 FL=1
MQSEQDVNRAIEQYADTVKRICVLHLKNDADTEDIFQTVFLKYALRSALFESPEHEKAWLIRVNINICKNMLRFHRRHPAEVYESLAASPHSLEENRIMDILMALRSKEKEGLILHYIEGYSCREIGQILKISENAVKKRLERARNSFKKQYEEAEKNDF